MKHQDAIYCQRIKEKGGNFLGKANLSEWQFSLFWVAQMAIVLVGGQTLNALMARMKFRHRRNQALEVGSAIAANYAVVKQWERRLLDLSFLLQVQILLVGLKTNTITQGRSGIGSVI